MNRLTDVGAEDREVKLYCAASARSAGFSLLAGAWVRGEGVNPYLGAAPVRSAGFSPSDNAFTTKNAKHAEKRGLAPARPYPPVPVPCFSTSYTSYDPLTTEGTEDTETVRGGSDWLDERATEALLSRAGVLCYSPQYPVYEKQTFAYDGWRVIQEHKKTDGNGIPMATAIPVARQFTYGNYLDEALTVDADTDSDGDCIDSGGSTRYYYHQNSLFSVVALSDTSANYKEGYQYDPYGRHVRLTDGNDGDTYVNFNTNDTRSALATSAYGNPYLFTGQRLDSESGLYYYKNRYYSTSQGRFISRDPIGYGGGINLYPYVDDQPTGRLDPHGLLFPGQGTVGGGLGTYPPWLGGGGMGLPRPIGPPKPPAVIGSGKPEDLSVYIPLGLFSSVRLTIWKDCENDIINLVSSRVTGMPGAGISVGDKFEFGLEAGFSVDVFQKPLMTVEEPGTWCCINPNNPSEYVKGVKKYYVEREVVIQVYRTLIIGVGGTSHVGDMRVIFRCQSKFPKAVKGWLCFQRMSAPGEPALPEPEPPA